ncbi:hypothetical protein SK803_08785 [Lentzea sp. BCCO 10_0856]|uniref:Uncharacterized protein n=1 Tax=Lentzea miocenica TaxID=3095431 RepID=A0ABU4SWL2_9PSEU|nr:hypothetical protein [Lentzea sp. BCCO 10_0856]MDX8030305.1 hypothetical protein [Lentzea sp. BCCO 10_0856]
MLKYLEPRTDVPAKDDWSTRLSLRDDGVGTEHRVVAFLAVVTFAACFFVPSSAANTVAMVVLGWILLLYLVAPLVGVAGARALRRGLLDEPWRRVPATVAEKPENDPCDRVLLDGLVLKGSFHDLPDMILDRQEVFVCGPDADGRAMIRAAGSADMRPAEVDEGEYPPAARVDRALGRPQDDPALREAARLVRVLIPGMLGLLTVSLVIAGVLVALSVSPVVPTGLMAAGLLVLPTVLDLPAGIGAARRARVAANAVLHSEQWVPAPITLFPWRRGHHLAGIADLPDGPALVRFPNPDVDVTANVVDTGVVWIAGRHGDLIAVGVPWTNSLAHAVVSPRRAGQQADPTSWFRRWRQKDLSDLPGSTGVFPAGGRRAARARRPASPSAAPTPDGG